MSDPTDLPDSPAADVSAPEAAPDAALAAPPVEVVAVAETVTSDGETEIEVAGITDGAYTLFVADFNDTESAWEAYEALEETEDKATVKIEGVIVVKRDQDGTVKVQKATDHSTRKGLAWGAVGGAVLGVIFPPSIIGSVLVLGAAGAATGKAAQMHHRNQLAEGLEDVIEPGHSGLLAVVSDPGEVRIRKALAKANAIVESAVDDVVAKDLKAAAKASGGSGS